MANPNPVEVPAAELIEDFSIYPRHAVDGVHVGNLVRVLEAGGELPPIIADRKSKRLSDGWHRRRAWIRHLGPEARVPVLWQSYKNDAEIFEDAVKRNSAHGRRLDRQDEIRVTIIGARLGLPNARVAVALRVTEERIDELSVRVVIHGSERVPGKRVSRPFQGQQVTDEQAQALASFGGNSLLQTTEQVCRAVKSGLFDRNDQRVLDALHGLAIAIVAHVPQEAGGGDAE